MATNGGCCCSERALRAAVGKFKAELEAVKKERDVALEEVKVLAAISDQQQLWLAEKGAQPHELLEPRERMIFSLIQERDNLREKFRLAQQQAANLNQDLGEMERLRNQAMAERDALRAAIRAHRDARGHDRCWENDVALYRVLGEPVPDGPGLPSHGEFIMKCEEYFAGQCKLMRTPEMDAHYSAERAAEAKEKAPGNDQR
jgi:hypothetical protein